MQIRFSTHFSKLAILGISLNFPLFMASAAEIKLHAASDGTVESVVTHVKTDLPADQDKTVKIDEPLVVRLNQKIPIILVPLNGGRQVTVDSPRLDEVIKGNNEEQVNLLLSEILDQIVGIQQDMQHKQFDNAYKNLTELEAKHPEVTFLEYLRASLLLLMGKKTEAEAAAQAAYRKFPSYKGAKEFLETIKGKKNE